MKLPIKRVFAVALVVEAVNLWLLAPPLDIGYEPGTPWYVLALGEQWILLHRPGFYLTDRIERLSGCQQRNIPGGCSHIDMFTFFVTGYLDTVLLLLVIVLGLQWVRSILRPRSHASTR